MNQSTPGIEDFDGAALGDARRLKRLRMIAQAVAKEPKETLPTIAGGAAELEGLYRFVNNPAVDFEALHEPHQRATAERAAVAGIVLAIHDTTSFQLGHADPKEVGYLQTGKPGFYGHFSLLVSAEGLGRPLGVSAVDTLFRPSKRRRKSKHERGGVTTKRADRESKKWERGVQQTEQLLEGCAECIHVADREADAYQLLALLVEQQWRFVIRVRHDRRARSATADESEWSKLKELAASAESCLERDVPLSPRRGATAPAKARTYPGRKARRATLRFAATKLVLRRPSYFGDELPRTIELNVVRVYEVDAPAGQEPVEWLLTTSEPVDTAEQVARVVDIYRKRWLIEEFFKALKTGCIYEQRQLESRRALLNTLALFLPVACQLLWVRSRARHAPNAPATDVLSQQQIHVLRALSKRPLPTEMTAADVLRAVAEIGGHWRSNGPPGWLILRRGLEKVLNAELGWIAHENMLANANHR